MFALSIDKRLKRCAAAAVILTLAGGLAASLALARITYNTIDPIAVVADNGRHLIVTGPLNCTAGERAYLRVTVTQRTTGAVAEGSSFVTCAGVIQQWEVHAQTQGAASFVAGAATAVALGTTSSRGKATDAHQWLVNVTLVAE